MVQLTVEPYKNFKFRVKWDGHYIAGVSSISPLTRTTGVGTPSNATLRAFRGFRKSPDVTRYEPVIIQRGKTHDPDFETWAAQTCGLGMTGSQAPARDFRKDITIEVLNEAGQVCMAYKLHSCWVSRYRPLSELNANAPCVLLEEITIECESWERDASVPEPMES